MLTYNLLADLLTDYEDDNPAKGLIANQYNDNTDRTNKLILNQKELEQEIYVPTGLTKNYTESIFTTGDIDTADVQGFVNALSAKGLSLVQLLDNRNNFADWAVADFTVEDGFILYTADGSSNQDGRVDTTLLSNTTYTCVSYVIENTMENAALQLVNDASSYNGSPNLTIAAGELGIVKGTFTTGTIVANQFRQFTPSIETLGNKLKLKTIILEGDWTSYDDAFLTAIVLGNDFGIQSVENPNVKSVGNNKYNAEIGVTSSVSVSVLGANELEYVPDVLNRNGYVKVKVERNKDYYLDFAVEEATANNGNMAVYTNDTVSEISAYSPSGRTFNSGDNDVLRIYFRNSSTVEKLRFYNISLTYGISAIVYKPYQETNLTAYTTLRNINNIYDEVNKDGKAVRRIVEFTYDTPDPAIAPGDPMGSFTNLDYLQIRNHDFIKAVRDVSSAADDVLFEGFGPDVGGSIPDAASAIGKFWIDGGGMYFTFPVGKYTTALEALNAEIMGRKILVAIDEPFVEDVTIDGDYQAFPDGTTYNTSDTFQAELDIEYGVNMASQIMKNTQRTARALTRQEAKSSEEKTYFPFNVLRTPTDALGIPTSMVGTGLTLQNAVPIDGWSGSNSTVTGDGASLLCTGNGGSVAPIFTNGDSIPMSSGDKIFVYSSAKVDTSDCQVMYSYIRDGANVEPDIVSFKVSNPEQDVLYEIYHIVTIANGGLGDFRGYHQYADAATANGKEMAISNIQAINMTVLNIEHYTEEQMLELVRGGHIDGLKSAPVDLYSVGVNLTVLRQSTYYVDPSTSLINYGDEYTVTYMAKIVGGETYTVSKPDGATDRFRIDFTEDYPFVGANKSTMGAGIINDSATEITITAPYGARYMVIYIGYNKEYIRVMVNKGTVALDYTPYTSSLVTSSYELASLPNGVADTLDFITGKKVKQIGKHVLTENDITSLVTSDTNVDRVTVSYLADTSAGTGFVDGKSLIEGFIGEVQFADIDNTSSEWKFYQASNEWRLIVPKGEYVDLNAARADLVGTVVYYQLVTPIIEQTDLDGFLIPRQDGQVTNDPLLKLDISWPTNIQASLESTEMALNRETGIGEWKRVELLNAWLDGPSTTRPLSYQKGKDNVVRLAGYITDGVATTDACILPEGFRPLYDMVFPTSGSGGTTDTVNKIIIRATGEVEIQVLASTGVYLDGINFLAEQ